MFDEPKRADHTRLVLGMADRQGLDLQEMLLRAELSQEQLDDAVDRCVGCTRPNTCKKMLKSADTVMSLPEYCRNGELFRTMAAK
ncbi:DUF6455 family protein [Marivita sp. S2033]|uniref:DUF6455 family protein n=1 Tax=Marivita sp. S2033 TaxID=3373187 RepID=UPI003982D294